MQSDSNINNQIPIRGALYRDNDSIRTYCSPSSVSSAESSTPSPVSPEREVSNMPDSSVEIVSPEMGITHGDSDNASTLSTERSEHSSSSSASTLYSELIDEPNVTTPPNPIFAWNSWSALATFVDRDVQNARITSALVSRWLTTSTSGVNGEMLPGRVRTPDFTLSSFGSWKTWSINRWKETSDTEETPVTDEKENKYSPIKSHFAHAPVFIPGQRQHLGLGSREEKQANSFIKPQFIHAPEFVPGQGQHFCLGQSPAKFVAEENEKITPSIKPSFVHAPEFIPGQAQHLGFESTQAKAIKEEKETQFSPKPHIAHSLLSAHAPEFVPGQSQHFTLTYCLGLGGHRPPKEI